jgi:energy-coupling factor transporter ATP-binding protein EcfA2
MQAIDIVIESEVPRTFRTSSLESVFDCPIGKKQRLEWHVEVPGLEDEWSIGMIVGPSGSGKSTVMKHAYGEPINWEWPHDKALIDALAPDKQMTEVSAALGAVGLNTIPSWARPFHVLSNGEQFRATIARHFLEDDRDPIVIDEFTSVVDRQVAQIASHAVQKFIRKNQKRFVAVTCHYDIIEWLQPDWVLDMATGRVERPERRRRPAIEVTLARVPYSLWKTFAPYHYMSAELHKAAQCYAAFVHDRPVCIGALLPRPVSSGRDKGTAIHGLSRLVTLPDYQGLGIAFVLTDALGGMFANRGERMNCYPAHPALIASFARNKKWRQVKQAGTVVKQSRSDTIKGLGSERFNAVFSYVGPKLDIQL